MEVRARASHSRLRACCFHKLSGNQTPLHLADIERFLAKRNSTLVVISNGSALPPIDLLELCVERRQPFVTIGQANEEVWWPDDDVARRYRKALPAALRCYFVSDANRRLAEKQMGVLN